MKPKTDKTQYSLFAGQNFAYYLLKIRYIRTFSPWIISSISKLRLKYSETSSFSPKKSSFKQVLFKLLPKSIGIFVLIWILQHIGFKKPLILFKSLGFDVLIPILILNFIHIMFKTERWRCILQKNKEKYPFFNAYKAYFSGIAAGIATPGRSGEFVRAVYPSKEFHIPFYKSLASVFADRFYDLFFLFGVTLISFYLILPIKVFGMLFLWFVIFVFLLYKFRYFIKTLLTKFFTKLGFRKQKTDFFISSFFNSFNSPFKPFLLSAAGYSVMVIQLYILSINSGITIGFVKLFLLLAAANTFALLPVSISGLGTREAALGFLFAHIGHSVSDGVSLSLMFFFSVSLPVTITGLFILLFYPNKTYTKKSDVLSE